MSMNLDIAAKKFDRNLHDYGFLVAIKKSILHLISAIYEKKVYRIYTIDLRNYSERQFKNREFTFKIITEKDGDIINQIEALEEWLIGKVKAKLGEGGLCFVAMDKERVAGFNLVAFDHVFIPLITMNKHLSKHEAWSEQITVDRNYRRKGLGTELRHRVFAELKSRNIRKLFGGTLAVNRPNLKLTRKVGLREIVDIQYFKWMGVKSRRYKRLR